MEGHHELNIKFAEASTRLEDIGKKIKQLERQIKTSANRKITFSKASNRKYSRRSHRGICEYLEINERKDPQLFRASASGWSCFVYKIATKNQEKAEDTFNQLLFLDEIDNSNILPVLQLRKEYEEIQMFIQTPSISLSEYLNQYKYLRVSNGYLQPSVITNFALQIASGLEYLRTKDIVHRSLNNNFIYIIQKAKDDLRILLAPYYMSKYQHQWSIHKSNYEYYNDDYFQAPELRRYDPEQPSFESDIWSFGLILFHLITLQDPYNLDGLTKEEKESLLSQAPNTSIRISNI